MSEYPVPTVKAFMSYAWSSEAHETWVLELAARLTADGVEVVFDKWDLKVGYDANAFMEKMVTESSVTKVLMICDRTYKEKADGRMGGVGKETTILTSEIYDRTEQDKYAAIITEHDENGIGFVPAYYGGRQYIDFTDQSKSELKYQELLRWIFDKPKHVRPKLGSVPSFITNPDAVVTGTTSKFRSAEGAIRTNSNMAGGHITDFGEAMIYEFIEHKPVQVDGEHFDDLVLKSAESMRPALRNFHNIVLAESRFGGSNFERIIRILENMGNLMYRPSAVTQWSEVDFDSYRMMCYEGFLGMIAILVSEQRFDLVGQAVLHPYFMPQRSPNGGPATTSFRVFSQDIEIMRQRKQRLKLNRVDLYSDIIFETYKISYPSMQTLIEADLLLYIRGQIVPNEGGWENWWPRTIIYASHHTSLELFSRSESLLYFSKWASKIFGDIPVAEFQAEIRKISEHSRRDLGGYGPSIATLTNSKNLGTRT